MYCLKANVILLVCTFILRRCDADDKFVIDKNGYVMFCPCMGRFGNQADQFLGSLYFAKTLDRTLILPPWVEYGHGGSWISTQIPFDRYFKVESVAQYHRVILMQDFMTHLADKIWPKGKRISFCSSNRGSDDKADCKARDGNPFDSFWKTYDITFDASEVHSPLYYGVDHKPSADGWRSRYPADKWPVLAFAGAPSPFPPPQPTWELQKYAFQFSDYVTEKAHDFIIKNIKYPFIGIHLRNGQDWKNACDHVKAGQHLFDSPQCLGQRFEKGQMSKDICYPSDKMIVSQVIKAAKKYGAKTIFVATDSRDLKEDILKMAKKKNLDLTFARNSDSMFVHLDLAVLSEADVFIGNCASTFSSFVARQRKIDGKPTQFFGVKENADQHKDDEL